MSIDTKHYMDAGMGAPFKAKKSFAPSSREKPQVDMADHVGKYQGAIVGWIRRGPKMTVVEGVARARKMPWWRKGLVMDSRTIRWFVWREKA